MKNLSFMDGYLGFNSEFLVMENGSMELFKKLERDSRLRYFWRKEKGLGWALREGLRQATCSQVFFLPADLSYDLSFVTHAQAYLKTGYSMVIGSKALGDSEVNRPLMRRTISMIYNLGLRVRYGPGWPGDITGTKAYMRENIMPLLNQTSSDGVFFEVELMKAMRRANLKVKEIAVKVSDTRPSRVKSFLFVPRA